MSGRFYYTDIDIEYRYHAFTYVPVRHLCVTGLQDTSGKESAIHDFSSELNFNPQGFHKLLTNFVYVTIITH